RKMLTFERDLRRQLEQLMAGLRKSRDELHIAPESLEAVVQVGLALAGHPPLEPATIPPRSGDAKSAKEKGWAVPVLGGTWSACLDGTADPLSQPPRPITFDPEIARARDDVVLAHLGHRLVQMCVGLLRAEVWAPEEQRKLTRVSARAMARLEHPVLLAY